MEEGEGGENGEDALVLERLGCGSRLSNISAIMEMFGEQVNNPLSSRPSSSYGFIMAGQSGVTSSSRPILSCFEGEPDEQGKQNQVNHSQVHFNSEKCPKFWMEKIGFPCQNIPKTCAENTCL